MITLDLSFNYLKPFDELDLIRLGKKNDGGYIISKKSLEMDNCLLTFGMCNEWSFEEEFIKLNSKNYVHIYDHTVDLSFFLFRLYKSIKRLFYFKSNFSNVCEKTKELIKYIKLSNSKIKHYKKKISNENSLKSRNLKKSLDEMKINGKLMLKIDIEGDEFEILKNINLYSEKIHTLIVEFHDLDKKLDDFEKLIKYINKKFYIIHIHGNNYSKCVTNGIPNTLEITFLNSKMFFIANKQTKFSFPIENLDFPNDSTKKDIDINFQSL